MTEFEDISQYSAEGNGRMQLAAGRILKMEKQA